VRLRVDGFAAKLTVFFPKVVSGGTRSRSPMTPLPRRSSFAAMQQEDAYG
jgi:hypothetical protein